MSENRMLKKNGIDEFKHRSDPKECHCLKFYHWKTTDLSLGSSALLWYKNFVIHNPKYLNETCVKCPTDFWQCIPYWDCVCINKLHWV